MILFRPVGWQELHAVSNLDWRSFPPLPLGYPIFTAVLNFAEAREIAEGWHAIRHNPLCGFVVRFEVKDEYIQRFDTRSLSTFMDYEIWVPTGRLEELNANIIGQITVEAKFYGSSHLASTLHIDKLQYIL